MAAKADARLEKVARALNPLAALGGQDLVRLQLAELEGIQRAIRKDQQELVLFKDINLRDLGDVNRLSGGQRLVFGLAIRDIDTILSAVYEFSAAIYRRVSILLKGQKSGGAYQRALRR